jgi:hypothetical protein
MFKVNSPAPKRLIRMYTGSGDLVKGALVVISSNTAVAGAEGISSATILGVAAESSVATAMATIDPVGGQEIEMDIYLGGATDTVTDAMVGVLYDIYVDSSTKECFLDLNDTTNPFVLINRYDNATHKAWCTIPNTYLYVS